MNPDSTRTKSTGASPSSALQALRTPVTADRLFRWSGLAAMLAGLIFAVIQPVHPPDTVASVTTTAWGVITPLKTVMCLLLLVGVTGTYVRQSGRAGWPGLLGYAVFSLGWLITSGFVFAETFILPPLASAAPEHVDAFLGVAAGRKSALALGIVPALFAGAGVGYMLGGALLGLATVRAGFFPRWTGGLMAATAALTPLAAVLPHAIQRFAAVPMGVAFIGLGYTLWTGRADHPKRDAFSTVEPDNRTRPSGR